jgi:hypothetical protein
MILPLLLQNFGMDSADIYTRPTVSDEHEDSIKKVEPIKSCCLTSLMNMIFAVFLLKLMLNLYHLGDLKSCHISSFDAQIFCLVLR